MRYVRKKPCRIKKRISSFGILGCFLFLLSCAGSPTLEPEDGLLKWDQSDYLRYSVQVGAFSSFQNAIRYKNRIMKHADAFCFRDHDGLYKIRFGNFESRSEAVWNASDLMGKNIIDGYFIISPERYQKPGIKPHNTRKELVKNAKKYLGVPYRWGGESASTGFDCSGLTLSVYRESGINLPRTARNQHRKGVFVLKKNLKKGDLIFFKTGRGSKITHVGIYIGKNRFIHAPGKGKKVKTESLSHSYYKAKYGGGRSYL